MKLKFILTITFYKKTHELILYLDYFIKMRRHSLLHLALCFETKLCGVQLDGSICLPFSFTDSTNFYLPIRAIMLF